MLNTSGQVSSTTRAVASGIVLRNARVRQRTAATRVLSRGTPGADH